MTTNAAIVRTDEVSKAFGGLRAVDGVSVDVPAGSVYGLLGPNGAGKTTLLNLINGILAPSSGAIEICSRETTGAQACDVARIGVARTFQTIKLVDGLSIVETVVAGRYRVRSDTLMSAGLRLPAERRQRRVSRERAVELIERVGLHVPVERFATSLSYGEQRRLEIARALASEPTVLLLDEPTAGMNARESAELGKLLTQLCQEGLTLLMVEHNMALVREICSHAAVLNSGRLIATGPPASCLEQPQVQEAYFGKG